MHFRIQKWALPLLAAGVISFGCQPSVLNEIEIEQPSLFKVKVKIDEKRKRKRQLQVTVRDKNGNPVEFSNGQVTVNGQSTEYSHRTVISMSRGYNYRIPGGVQEFEINIQWNETDSYTFLVDRDAGFPGFEDKPGWNISKGSESFVITPAPFAGNKIVVEFDIMK